MIAGAAVPAAAYALRRRLEDLSDREAVDRFTLMCGGSMPPAHWTSIIRGSCTAMRRRPHRRLIDGQEKIVEAIPATDT